MHRGCVALFGMHHCMSLPAERCSCHNMSLPMPWLCWMGRGKTGWKNSSPAAVKTFHRKIKLEDVAYGSVDVAYGSVSKCQVQKDVDCTLSRSIHITNPYTMLLSEGSVSTGQRAAMCHGRERQLTGLVYIMHQILSVCFCLMYHGTPHTLIVIHRTHLSWYTLSSYTSHTDRGTPHTLIMVHCTHLWYTLSWYTSHAYYGTPYHGTPYTLIVVHLTHRLWYTAHTYHGTPHMRDVTVCLERFEMLHFRINFDWINDW